MEPQEKVTLANLAMGGAVELFDEELRKVMENIADINTDPKTARTITLQVKIVPDKDRSFGPVEISCASKMAPVSKLSTRLFFGKDRGNYFAIEHDPTQERFDFNSTAEVVSIVGKK